MTDESKSILWIDDQIDRLGPFVSALENEGFRVTTASSGPEGLESAKSESYDIILIDILMPPPDGIEVTRKIKPLQPQAMLGVLSSYLYLDRYRGQLRQLAFEVELIDKDFPNVEAPDFSSRFIEPIRKLGENGITNTIKKQDRDLQDNGEEDPFSIPLVEFMKMPILQKDKIIEKARKMAFRAIEGAFSEGNIWVLLCGSKTQIRASATKPTEIPSLSDILEFAKVQQRPPYQFFRPVDVDDVWGDCGDAVSLKDYPTVTLDFGEEELVVHFDTGAPMTFFSYEELLRLGAVQPTTNFATAQRGAQPYKALPIDIRTLLKDQGSGQKTIVRITGQAVRDWLNAPYSRRCFEDCPKEDNKFSDQNYGLCPERRALIGRNLITENGLILILDGIKKITKFGDQ